MEIGGRCLKQEFIVVSGLKTKCILGIDFIAQQGMIINAKEQIVSWKEPASKPTLRATKDMQIAPRTGRRLRLRAEGMCESEEPTQDWLMFPRNNHVEDALVQIDQVDRETWVLIENTSDYPITLSKDEIVGELEAIDEICPLSKLENVSESANSKNILHKVEMAGVPSEHRPKYEQLLKEFSSVLAKSTYDVGHTNLIKHDIILKDPEKIACTPPYRTPEHLRAVAEEYIENLAKAGIIRRSVSPFSSPLMLVRKGDAKPDKPLIEQYRVVHDYRRLNDNTVKDSYPMRNLYELLDSVAQAKVWSVIDLSSGFWNQSLTERAKPYTAFGLPGQGHWEYTRSAQGLTNSPAAFQRLLDHILADISGVFVYIDDVIICSQTHEEHLRILRSVLSRFRKYNLKVKPSKLQLATAEVNYLGYNLSKDKGIRAGEAKIEAVKRWPIPSTITEIKQFLGLCSFFRRTINRFAEIAQPLTRLTRKDSGWTSGELGSEAKDAFLHLKRDLCSRPCLRPVSFDREFTLTTDASKIGLGAVLSQTGDDGEEHPCAYASRVLSPTEQNWAPTNLEYLAMLWGCKHFKPYLVGRHFTIRTDHKPLVSLNRVQGSVLERMRAELQEFQPFTVKYLKGERMPADGLSRTVEEEVHEILESRQLPGAFTPDQVYYLQKQDKHIKALVVAVKFKQEPRDSKLLEFVRPLIPITEIKRGIAFIRHNGKLLALAPFNIRPILLYHCHDSPMAGHRAFNTTLGKLQEKWFWPEMAADVEHHCKACKTCLAVNRPPHNRPGPMGRFKPAMFFNDRVHADLLGWLPNDQGNRYLLVMQDAFSKWTELVPLENKTADHTASQILEHWIHRHGCMETLVSDQGKEFANQVMAELCARLHIAHQTTSAMHPQANGLVERTNRTILTYLRKYLEGTNNWVELLPALQFSLNTTVHASSGQTPFLLVHGRAPRVPAELFDPNLHPQYAEENISVQLRQQAAIQQKAWQAEEEAWSKQKKDFDKRSRTKSVRPGDVVYLNRPHSGGQFQKFQPLYFGPFKVVALHANSSVELMRENGKILRVHADRVKLASFAEQLFVGGPTGPENLSTRAEQSHPKDEGPEQPIVDDGEPPAVPAAGPPPPAAEDEPMPDAPASPPPQAPAAGPEGGAAGPRTEDTGAVPKHSRTREPGTSSETGPSSSPLSRLAGRLIPGFKKTRHGPGRPLPPVEGLDKPWPSAKERKEREEEAKRGRGARGRQGARPKAPLARRRLD
jgi:hypothetical protein